MDCISPCRRICLPPRNTPIARSIWGTMVDFWFCLVVYGLLELGAFLGRDKNGKDSSEI